MKDNRIKNIILWTIVIAYTLWIFHNSAQTGKVSANLSQTLSYRIYDSLQFLHFIPFQLFHTLIRKFAQRIRSTWHLGIYNQFTYHSRAQTKDDHYPMDGVNTDNR